MFGVVRPANFGLYGHNWLTTDIPVFEERQSLCSKKDNPRVRGKTILVFEERHSLCSEKDIPCVRRKTFLVFEERHSLCLTKDAPSVPRKTSLVFEDDKKPIFGRTDLRKGVSEAKFDGQADFDIKKSPAPPKSAENHEKPKTKCEKSLKNRLPFCRFGIV